MVICARCLDLMDGGLIFNTKSYTCFFDIFSHRFNDLYIFHLQVDFFVLSPFYVVIFFAWACHDDYFAFDPFLQEGERRWVRVETPALRPSPAPRSGGHVR